MDYYGLAEFLDAHGIGWVKRKFAAKSNPIDNIEIGDESITIGYTG